jgi:hypothetical protein
VSRILFMSSGVMVWALHFTAIYGITGLACARGWHSLVLPSIAVATALAAIASIAIVAAALPRRAQFEYWMSACLAALALLAIVWEAIPVFLVPICG